MKDIALILKSLGLIDSEIKTYLSSLEKGPATVIELSKATGLSRQACYVAIESLNKRGLMSSVMRGKKHYFTAEHPDKLVSFAKRRMNEIDEQVRDLERSVPELELQMGGDKPVVRVFEGKEGIRAILEDFKNTSPKSIDEISDLNAMYTVIKLEELAPYRKELRRINPKIRGLYSGKTESSVLDVNRKLLPDEYSNFKSNVSIYGDKIALVTFEGKMNSVIIESKNLAKTLKILYELAFASAEKFKSL